MKVNFQKELLEIVKRNYEEISESFNLTRRKEIWPEIKILAEGIKEGDKILDLGCGNGRLVEALKDKTLEYLGIDASSELISKAKLNYPGYSFLVQDIIDLKFNNDKKYNYIFCLAVLQHIPGTDLRISVLKRMKELLLPGGKIIVSNWNLWRSKKHRILLIKKYLTKLLGRNELDFGDIIFPWKNSQGEEVSTRYYHGFTAGELRSLSKKAGLKIEKLYRDNYNYWLILK